MLGLGSQGLRHMYGRKPVQKVADLKGVKMRVQATVTEDNAFPAYVRWTRRWRLPGVRYWPGHHHEVTSALASLHYINPPGRLDEGGAEKCSAAGEAQK